MTTPSVSGTFEAHQGDTLPILTATLFGATTQGIITKALTANVATLGTSMAHGWSAGRVVAVSGVGAPFDGVWTLSAGAGTTFSFARVSANVTLASCTGTAKAAVDLTPVGTVVVFQMAPVDGGTLKVNVAADVASAPGGAVSYTWATGDLDTAGEYRGFFSVTIPGVGVQTYPAEGIRILVSPAVTAPRSIQGGPCFEWTDAAAVRACTGGLDAAADLTVWIRAASEILYTLMGARWPGLCSATVRPNVERCGCGCHAYGGPLWGMGLSFGGMSAGWPMLPQRLCRERLYLGRNVRAVTSVLIDGAVVDPTTYRLDRREGMLVRLADPTTLLNPSWPCCQRLDLPSSAVGTFEIAYTYGEEPPAYASNAAAVLAGQFALACNPGTAGSCLLPQRVQTISRQGESMTFVTDVTTIFSQGFAGIPEVDLSIQTANPEHLQGQAQVYSPDIDLPWDVTL